MFKELKLIIVEHIGLIIVTVIIIISLYYLLTQMVFTTNRATDKMIITSDLVSNNESRTYDNTILSGTEVLTTIKKYYNKNDIFILLLNNSKNYNNTGDRFWVTGRSAKYGQNNNFESIIISTNYNDVTELFIDEKSISSVSKKELSTYSTSNDRNSINLSSKYKSVLLKCNGYIVGMAFLAI